MFNKVTLIGRLGKDPELGNAGGKPYCHISVATNESWKSQDGEKHERTEWHSVTIWGRSAEYVGSYASKGSLVFVEGQLRNRTWTDQAGNSHKAVEVHVNLNGIIKILDGSKVRRESQPDQSRPQTEDQSETKDQHGVRTLPAQDEDLPF